MVNLRRVDGATFPKALNNEHAPTIFDLLPGSSDAFISTWGRAFLDKVHCD